MNIDQVIEYYNQCLSMRQTANYFEVNQQKIKKMLITGGAYETPVSKKIIELYNSGFTPEKIQEKLKISHSTVFANLPYLKGQYNSDNPTINAIRIRKCRNKNTTE